MNDNKIFERAVAKAVENGYAINESGVIKLDPFSYDLNGIAKVIYSHAFARALFGEDWQEHLKVMVLSGNPVQYLEEYI